jgi:hypothetical protein
LDFIEIATPASRRLAMTQEADAAGNTECVLYLKSNHYHVAGSSFLCPDTRNRYMAGFAFTFVHIYFKNSIPNSLYDDIFAVWTICAFPFMPRDITHVYKINAFIHSNLPALLQGRYRRVWKIL